jgi:maleylacetate reductase
LIFIGRTITVGQQELENSMMIPGVHRFYMMDRIVHGQPAAEALKAEVDRLEKSKVFLITNKSLTHGPRIAEMVRELGNCYAGQYAGVTAHGPRQCVIDGANAARAAQADLLVAVGGGSVIDAAKVMQLCLRNSIRGAAALSSFTARDRGDPSKRPADADQWIRVIAIPTTLSAAEFTWFGGAFDPESGAKEAFSNPMMIPQVIIMDPRMTMETPMRLLLTTGMKAVDHAAERLASLKSNPYNDAVSTLALQLLSSGLRTARRESADNEARSQLQYGAFMSMSGAAAGGAVGISHAIGHALGAQCGVPHGETSCVMLPAVMQWNHPSNPDRQSLVAESLGYKGGSASTALADLVAELGLPRTLRDVGVTRKDFPAIAQKALGDILAKSNPRPVQTISNIEEILELAW